MSTKDLIDAISTGDAVGIESSFNAVMAEKISAKLDVMRQDIAQSMFKNVNEESEQLDELSKSTLSSYATKAKADSKKEYEAGRQKQMAASNASGPFDRIGSSYNKHYAKSDKRDAGVEKANKRLNKEETE